MWRRAIRVTAMEDRNVIVGGPVVVVMKLFEDKDF
jgi:hypothetical protein